MNGSDVELTEAGTGWLGSNQTVMRARNERLVLSILRRQGPLPKAEIARTTGLSAQTVSVIMRALEKDGLLERGEKLRGKVGQPSVPMRLVPDGALFLGLKVGRRSAELVLVNFVGDILARQAVTYRFPTPEGTLDFLREAYARITGGLSTERRARIAGLGISIPFHLWEWASVIGVDESEMAAWRDCDLRADTQAMFDIPVYLGNDGTCACGAELVFGQGDTPPDFLYIYVGYFIGGGVVLNGSLYTGSANNAGAIGPFPVGGAGRQLVDVASLVGLERRLLAAGGDAQAMWENPEAWEVDQRIIEDWMNEAAPAVSLTILAAISVIDFSAILIDGAMPAVHRADFVDRVRAALEESNLSGLRKPQVQAGRVGADARQLGAASIPLASRFML